ncbi:methionyl-tRNA formyltransferase [Treponema sp. OMZ 787]|uniref:methionyl-tRNA formyltransferase n=1 Tax=Treponema sp. OMZ 787 TaxID=2563669 RepID=UPI0020A53556|nr:formyltransferase family protein [Treponema sp. OMZ 787]UTC61611.1 methionyl-tRNA formyltransferase [Treponema sp. OMZ 787]
MRIMIITQGVSRIVRPLLDSNHDIVGIVEGAPRGYKSKNDFFIKRLYHKFFTRNTLKQIAKHKNIPYYFMTSSNDVKLQNWIEDLAPELIIVRSMSFLLKKNIFTIPKYGTINIHTALLPSYRGPSSAFWQYVNMETEQGVTIHYIDEGEDTGDILYQGVSKIPLGLKSPERLDILVTQIAVPALFAVIEKFENGTITPIKQPVSSPTPRARNLKLSEHSSFIKWDTWPIEKIWNILRGTELWLNALDPPKGMYAGSRWIIDDYIKTSVTEKYVLGKIYKNKKTYFVVCKDGIINIHVNFNLKYFIKFLIRSFYV